MEEENYENEAETEYVEEEPIKEPSAVPVEEEVSADEIWYRGELLRSIDKILNDKVAEKELEGFPLFTTYCNTTKLTFLDSYDVSYLVNLFEADACRFLRSLPPWEHKPELYGKINQARILFFMNLKRSEGRGDINERTAISSLMKFVITGEIKQKRPGFLERLRGSSE